MQVTSVNHTPNPELAIVAAARDSASESTFEELWHKSSHTQIYDLPEQQLDSDHLSTFEHANFTFAIHGISPVFSHQLLRHCPASYTQQSQTFVPLEDCVCVTRPRVSRQAGLLVKHQQGAEGTQGFHCQMLETGIPAEDAHYIIPEAIETQLTMTLNVRELLHACTLRLHWQPQ